ncbi:MAG: GIY-YIG nuclease family protein [Bacteroidales bacterium]|nr:GIY-YIG nuclease family protein [Bacteroidales bacterium]
MTANIDQRINDHNHGKSKYTKSYMPWEIVFTIPAGSREEARILEKYYKSYRGRQKVWNEVHKKFGIQ